MKGKTKIDTVINDYDGADEVLGFHFVFLFALSKLRLFFLLRSTSRSPFEEKLGTMPPPTTVTFGGM